MRHTLDETGCWFEEDHPVKGNWTMHWCPLHTSAADLLAALEALVPFATNKIREAHGLPSGLGPYVPPTPEVEAILNASDFEMARVAIAKAKGES